MIQYVEEHPNVLFRQQRVYKNDEVKALLDQGALDYALTFEPLPAAEYEWTPLITEQYYLLVSAQHPFAEQETITLKELGGQRIILNDSDSPNYVDHQLREQGIDQPFAFIGDEYEVLGSMVERNAGVAMISALGLYDLRKNRPCRCWPGFGCCLLKIPACIEPWASSAANATIPPRPRRNSTGSWYPISNW